MQNNSYWLTSTKQTTKYPSLQHNIQTDILIIGAGISGLSSAYHLSAYTKDIVIVEADAIGYGASGRNTGKLSAQHGLLYHTLIQSKGRKQALLYYKAQQKAIDHIELLCKQHQIPCDFQRTNTLLYATTPKGKQRLQQEYEAYVTLQIPCSYHKQLPSSPMCAGLYMHHQAVFHPYKFLIGLSNVLHQRHIPIYEKSNVYDLVKQKDGTYHVHCNGHVIHAKKVIFATQAPIIDHGHLYFSKIKCEQERILAKKTQPKPTSLQIDAQQSSYHTHQQTVLKVCAKNSQPVTQKDNTYTHTWSNSDYTTIDFLPFIGPIDKDNPSLLFATGYGKWGNTNGFFAGKLLCDYCTQQYSMFFPLFSPSRSLPYLSKAYIKENIQNMTTFIKGHLATHGITIPQPLHAKKIQLDHHTYGIYQDEYHALFIVDITCPHLGCICNFNPIDKTWDCPCHGSRFSYTGEIIKGPTTYRLQPFHSTNNIIDPHIFKKKS